MANPLGSAPGIMVGIGVGTAAAAAIEPIVEPGRQQAWSNAPNRVLEPALYARLVAQGALDLKVGQPLARREGYNADQFNRLVYLSQTAPDLALTLELWRRGQFGDPLKAPAIELVEHALAKAQIEKQYWEPIKELFGERLAPPVIALAIVRGIMHDPGFLPVGPPSTEGKVKAFPVSGLDTLDEARASGFDYDRLFVETAIAGRPMAPIDSAHAVFRDILEKVDYDRAIAEGDIRNEWANAIFETARQIPSATDFVQSHLRGWIDEPGMNAGAARHGMSVEDVHTLFQIHGRPLSWHQVFIGIRRGGVYDGPIDDIHPAFLKALRESDIRPEWYNIAWAQRYSYPTAFVLRALTEAGDLTEQETHDVLLFEGWEPTLAAKVAAKWAQPNSTAKGNPWIAKAEGQWWTAAHKDFVKYDVPRSVIEPIMETFVPVLADRDAIFQWWTDERAVNAGAPPTALP